MVGVEANLRCSLGTHRTLGKGFDFLSDNADATFIRGVQLQDTLSVQFGSIQRSRQRQHGGGFTSARRAVEKQMGNISGINTALQCLHYLVLMGDVFNSDGAVLLHPRGSLSLHCSSLRDNVIVLVHTLNFFVFDHILLLYLIDAENNWRFW